VEFFLKAIASIKMALEPSLGPSKIIQSKLSRFLVPNLLLNLLLMMFWMEKALSQVVILMYWTLAISTNISKFSYFNCKVEFQEIILHKSLKVLSLHYNVNYILKEKNSSLTFCALTRGGKFLLIIFFQHHIAHIMFQLLYNPIDPNQIALKAY